MTEYARRSIVDRMRGAALLDVATYEEVEHDNEATGQAAVVVIIVAVCSAIGAVWRGGPSIIMAPVSAILGWLLWSAITYVIGMIRMEPIIPSRVYKRFASSKDTKNVTTVIILVNRPLNPARLASSPRK